MKSRLVLALLVIGACSSGSGADVRLSEFAIEAGAATAGSTVVVANDGEFAHTLLVTDADGAVVAGTEVLTPGSSTELVLDIAPGTYQFTCRIVVETGDGRIVDHFAEGMQTEVTVATGA